MKEQYTFLGASVRLPLVVGETAVIIDGCRRYLTEPVTAICQLTEFGVTFETEGAVYRIGEIYAPTSQRKYAVAA